MSVDARLEHDEVLQGEYARASNPNARAARSRATAVFASVAHSLSSAGRGARLPGPLAALRDVAIRVVLRPTALYEAIIKQAYHPDHLRDALEREPLFELLAAATRGRPELDGIIGWETADLAGGDVPTFSTRGASLDLEAPGGRRLPGFFAESGFDAAVRRLRSLNQDDPA